MGGQEDDLANRDRVGCGIDGDVATGLAVAFDDLESPSRPITSEETVLGSFVPRPELALHDLPVSEVVRPPRQVFVRTAGSAQGDAHGETSSHSSENCRSAEAASGRSLGGSGVAEDPAPTQDAVRI